MQAIIRGLLALGLLFATTPLWGDETADLIERLDGPEFAERQEASRKLSEAGKAVFPELEKAAESGSREVASRAVEILKTHFTRGDDETKAAAKAALERLTKSSNTSAAQRATDALTPPADPNQQPAINGIFGGGIRIAGGGNIQIQVQANGGGGAVNRRVKVTEANGKRDVEVEEGDRKVKIQTFPNGGIEMEITEKVNGKETTRKVEAKNLDELKKKDPGAAKDYEQYNQGGGNIRIGGIQIQGGGFQIPGGIPIAPAPNAPLPNVVPQGDARERQLKALEKSLEQFKAQLPQNPNAQRIIDILEQQKKRLEEAAKPADGK